MKILMKTENLHTIISVIYCSTQIYLSTSDVLQARYKYTSIESVHHRQAYNTYTQVKTRLLLCQTAIQITHIIQNT